MRLVRHSHACVSLHDGARGLLIDPGAFTPDGAALLAQASAVLVTHPHFDHLDVAAVLAALEERADLVVYGPAGVAEALAGAPAERVVVLADGDRIEVAGFAVEVVGGLHAPIHDEIPVPQNLGYLVDRAVFHPGDSYEIPPWPVDTLLVPTSGPWVRTGQSIDWIREIAPRRAVAIHDVMLSEVGRRSSEQFLGRSGIPLLTPAPGESLSVEGRATDGEGASGARR
ncbi:MBL fold metallo-hydrolase [Xylanimonas sp. McL0601]|uniref:MBL fold metallo-hydrolase n=1 Tax=Xylanimonas sp. McL0601 TaxID=3414739 RepID=UPI003CEA7D8D